METGPFNQILLISVAAFSVFGLLVLSVILLLKRDKRAERVRMITMRREDYNLMQQSSVDQARRLRRRMQARVNVMRAILEQFKLQRAAASRELKLRLAAAGLRHPSAPIVYVFSRLALAAGAVLLVTVFSTLSERLGSALFLQLVLIVASAAIGYILPAVIVHHATKGRQRSMSDSFPDMLDMLLICVESGLSINAAFARVAEETADSSPILSREIALLSAEMAFLGDRRQAYTNFADRTGLQAARTLATSLNQADRYGTPVGSALQVLAQENRDLRMSAAEKKAASLPAKLTVPMILFFMPALFVVLIGPVLLQLLDR